MRALLAGAGINTRKAKGNAIIALTQAVTTNAQFCGDATGKITMNKPVPITKGDAAMASNPTLSIHANLVTVTGNKPGSNCRPG